MENSENGVSKRTKKLLFVVFSIWCAITVISSSLHQSLASLFSGPSVKPEVSYVLVDGQCV